MLQLDNNMLKKVIWRLD